MLREGSGVVAKRDEITGIKYHHPRGRRALVDGGDHAQLGDFDGLHELDHAVARAGSFQQQFVLEAFGGDFVGDIGVSPNLS